MSPPIRKTRRTAHPAAFLQTVDQRHDRGPRETQRHAELALAQLLVGLDQQQCAELAGRKPELPHLGGEILEDAALRAAQGVAEQALEPAELQWLAAGRAAGLVRLRFTRRAVVA